MRQWTFLFFMAVVLTMSISACSSEKRIPRKAKPTEMVNNQKILEALTKAPANYDFLHAKAKVKFDSPDIYISGAMQLRIKAGEAIWVSITKFGLEAFRVFMTRDTVRVIDRLNRSYIEEPTQVWLEANQLPFGLRDIEMILLGKGLIPDAATYKIMSDEHRAEVAVSFRDYAVRYLLEDMFLPELTQMMIKDPEGQSIKVTLSEFQPIRAGSGNFPFHRNILKISGDLPFNEVEIIFSDVVLDEEKPMPFEVPKRYTRANP
jgi:hypothetical protein